MSPNPDWRISFIDGRWWARVYRDYRCVWMAKFTYDKAAVRAAKKKWAEFNR